MHTQVEIDELGLGGRVLLNTTERFGPHRLVFGTGLPVWDPALPVAGLTYAGLASEAFAAVSGGTLTFSADNQLGAASGPVTVNSGAVVQFTGVGSTGRNCNLNSGTLAVAAGANLSLNGAAVNGGFVRGLDWSSWSWIR